MMQNKNESGRSMIEMLGVLSIMGVIMYGAIAGINFGIDMYKINATHTEIEEMAQAIGDLYSWSENFDGLRGEIAAGYLVSSKIVCMNDAHPKCQLVNAEHKTYSITNEWGGDVEVEASECTDGQDCGNFNIIYHDVPRLACQRLKYDLEFRNVCLTRTACASGYNDQRNGCCTKTNMTFAFSDGTCPALD